jgi:glucokinase
VTAFPALIGDIGGTWLRLSVLASPDAAATPVWRAPTERFASLQEAAREALCAANLRPRTALFGVAGRITGPRMRLTNAPWTIDAAEVGMALGLEEVRLVNDYAPMAAVLTALDPDRATELVSIGPSGPADGPRLSLGPGTGFGAAALLPAGHQWLIQTSEAGHMSFGACQPDEFALWPLLEQARGRHSVESVLSGPGLVRLYRALAIRRGMPGQLETPAAVTAAAESGDALAGAALEIFCALLGRLAGDLALAFGATGGVFLCGGIAPRVIGRLRNGGFRRAFDDKAPHEALLKAVPVSVLMAPDPGLLGLTCLARQPERFIVPAARWTAAEGHRRSLSKEAKQ